MADAAARVGVVAAVAGDQMYVRMEDRLPGDGSAVDADVVAMRPELRVDCLLARFQEAPYRRDLVRRAVENRRYLPSRHDQRVTRRDGIPVAHSGSEIVARDPVGLVKEGTFHGVTALAFLRSPFSLRSTAAQWARGGINGH